jgi:hypothetical protein
MTLTEPGKKSPTKNMQKKMQKKFAEKRAPFSAQHVPSLRAPQTAKPVPKIE